MDGHGDRGDEHVLATATPEERIDHYRHIWDAWERSNRVYHSRAVARWHAELTRSPLHDPLERAVLQEVERSGPIRVSDLAATLGRTASNISKVTRHLVEAGLVRRHIPDNDRRVTLLEVTELGASLSERLIALDVALIDNHLAEFGDDEVAQLAELLTRFSCRVAEWQASGMGLPSQAERTYLGQGGFNHGN